MTRVYTVTVREHLMKGDKAIGNTARQETVKADSLTDAVEQVQKAIEKAQPKHAKNHEVIAAILTAEVPDA